MKHNQNRELNFNRQDAEQVWKALDEYRFGGGCFRRAEGYRLGTLRSLVAYLRRKHHQRKNW